jgi:hypothetical protein
LANTVRPIDGDDALTLAGGYPKTEAVPQLYDELDYQRAVQVYLWALPAVSVELCWEGSIAAYGASATTIPIFEHFLDARTLVATGNGQSIYAVISLDLREIGPTVVEAPPGVLGFIMDLWQYPLEDIGALGPDKGKGGPFLLIPPGVQLDPPAGYFVVLCDTNLLNICLRGYVQEGRTEPAVEAIKKTRIYSLAQKDAPPPMRFADASGVPATLLPVGDDLTGVAYFARLARIVEREPAREKDKTMLGLAASLGIRKGVAFEPDARMRDILERAARTGAAMAAALSYASRYPKKLTWPGKQWEEIAQTEEATMENPNFIEIDAKVTLTYQAMGASKALLLSVVGAGSKYSAAFRDSAGDWLMGEHAYRLRVPPDVPAKDFWSVTVYDAATRSMIDNDGPSGLDSYADLPRGADGAIDLWFGPQPPESGAADWVKTIPGQGFFLYFRWYGPLQAYFDKTWQLPDVERIG